MSQENVEIAQTQRPCPLTELGAGGSAGFGQLRARGRSQVGYVDPVCLRGRPT